jgi:hypothetical protein
MRSGITNNSRVRQPFESDCPLYRFGLELTSSAAKLRSTVRASRNSHRQDAQVAQNREKRRRRPSARTCLGEQKEGVKSKGAVDWKQTAGCCRKWTFAPPL